MLIALIVVILLLCGAVVLLFAMTAELSSRLAVLSQGFDASTAIMPLDDARIGAIDLDWPIEFARVPALAQATLIVLSTSCAACRDVARQISSQTNNEPDLRADFFVIISCPHRAIGEDFVRRHSLSELPHIVDIRALGRELNWACRPVQVPSSPRMEDS